MLRKKNKIMVLPNNLTKRELDVLKLVVKGYSNIEIAKELSISVNTSKAHVSSILYKLNITSRLQAAIIAVKSGLYQHNKLNNALKTVIFSAVKCSL